MKKINIRILSSLLCGVPVVAFAGQYDTYNKYDSYYNTQRYTKDNSSETTRSAVVPKNIRFFIGLNTSLISYEQVKISYKHADVEEKQSHTYINYKPFDNASFSFGLDSDNGFRFSIGITHCDTNTKFIDGSESDSTISAFGASVNIPFVKKEVTSPFVSLGISYITVKQGDLDVKFPAYYAGLGITHNFSNNIFGVLTAQYGFMSKAEISKIDAEYMDSGIFVNLGLGYRF